jgi:hypothetical protein
LPYCVSTRASGKKDPPLTGDGHRQCSLLIMNPTGSGGIHEVHSLGSDLGFARPIPAGRAPWPGHNVPRWAAQGTEGQPPVWRPLIPFHRASIARAKPFAAVRASSSGPSRVRPGTPPFTCVPLTSTDNAEADGSIPSSPTKDLIRRGVGPPRPCRLRALIVLRSGHAEVPDQLAR